jgi:hypothetical protein
VLEAADRGQPVYERLMRARRLSVAYQGPEGQQRFTGEDRDYVQAAIDLVATLEARSAAARAQRAAQAFARQLDRALECPGGLEERRRAFRNDDLHWPRRDGLKWTHLASVVVGVDVA